MSELNWFKDTTEKLGNTFSDCPLARQLFSEYFKKRDVDTVSDMEREWVELLYNYNPEIMNESPTVRSEKERKWVEMMYESNSFITTGPPVVSYNPRMEAARMEVMKNKLDGLRREQEVAADLEKQYPPEKGYSIISEAYLRDKDGNIVKDPITGEARRIDFVVVKDGKVVDSIEVTSKTADKTNQLAKEERIRESGGNYIRDENGNLIEIPSNVNTRIERRD